MTLDLAPRKWRVRSACPLPQHPVHEFPTLSPQASDLAARTIDQAKRDRLLSIYATGFASGIVTHLVNFSRVPAEIAVPAAQRFTARIANDPGWRNDTTDDLVGVWHGAVPTFKIRNAYLQEN